MQAHAERAVHDIDAIVERCAMVSRLDDEADEPQREPCQLAPLLSDVIAEKLGTVCTTLPVLSMRVAVWVPSLVFLLNVQA